MYKKWGGMFLVVAIIFGLSAVCFAQAGQTGDKFQMPPNPAPTVSQQNGTLRADIAQGKNPVIKSCTGVQGCCDFIMDPTKFSGTLLANDEPANYQPIADLMIANYQPKRDAAKLLISWTVRVVAQETLPTVTFGAAVCPQCVVPPTSTRQYFEGGLIKTALFVNGQKIGNTADLMMPDGGEVTVNQRPRDPTITGSWVLDAKDFDLSKGLKIEVKWLNQTALKIFSLADHHNLVVTEFPVSREAK